MATIRDQTVKQVKKQPAIFQWTIPALAVLTILLEPAPAAVISGMPALMTGDLLFQDSLSSQSEAIRRATGSAYSHVGMVVVKGEDILVLEAVEPVRYTAFKQWVARGRDHHFVAKRYAPQGLNLDASSQGKLAAEGEKYLGLPYDLWFLWSDERQYCSELVYKIYKRALGIELAPLSRLGSFDLSHPVVRNKMRERFGHAPPVDELVVPPSALFDSDRLVTVHSE